MSENQQPTNLAFYLPYGELLRTFLEQGFIAEKDLRDILRKRGVFLSDYSKQTAIPHLALATVTPSEFELLLGLQKTKQDSRKTVSETLEWTSDKAVIDAVPDQIDISKIFEKSISAKITNLSPPQKVDGDPNCVRYNFEVEKSSLHQSWHVEKTPHPGFVEIRKTEQGKQAVIEITSTIPETKTAGKRILKDVQDKLTISGDVPPKAKRMKVQFSSFDNAGRVKFFLSLTDTGSKEIVFSAMTGSSMVPDKSKTLPTELEKYFKKINKVNLEGDELQGSTFLTDKSYHPFILISRMVVTYNFKYHGGKGSCVVEYKFEGYPKVKGNHDFVTNPVKFDWDEKASPNKVVARRYIEAAIRDIVRIKSQPYFTEVVEAAPIPNSKIAGKPRRSKLNKMAIEKEIDPVDSDVSSKLTTSDQPA